MKNKILPYRLSPVLSRAALGLLLIASAVSCSTKPISDLQHLADRKERLTRGCIFYFDGAGGGTKKANYADGVVKGMLAAGYQGAGDIVSWETGRGLIKDQNASVEYKRSKATEGSEKIQKYQTEFPVAPVSLLGFSAGTAEVIFALEGLPVSSQVDQVVLLGTSISRDYDLTEALKRVKNKLYIYTSTHDRMVKTLMKFSGTADRKYFVPGAGIKGFVLPKGATEETKRLYAEKIVTINYSKDFLVDGNKGHHFDNVKMDFIREHVAPLLMEKPVRNTASPQN